MAEYGTVVPTGMFVEDARRALSLIVHTLTHTQPLSRGHIMTGRQQANKDRPPGRMQMQSRRKVMRRPPPGFRVNRANMLGVLQTGKIRVVARHIRIWMTAAACIALQ